MDLTAPVPTTLIVITVFAFFVLTALGVWLVKLKTRALDKRLEHEEEEK